MKSGHYTKLAKRCSTILGDLASSELTGLELYVDYWSVETGSVK